jgi:hypothetical protein
MRPHLGAKMLARESGGTLPKPSQSAKTCFGGKRTVCYGNHLLDCAFFAGSCKILFFSASEGHEHATLLNQPLRHRAAALAAE